MRRMIGIAILTNVAASAWYLPYLYMKVGKLPDWTTIGTISSLFIFILVSLYVGLILIDKK